MDPRYKYIQTNEWRVYKYDMYGGGKTIIGRLYECSTRYKALEKARELYPDYDSIERVILREPK